MNVGCFVVSVVVDVGRLLGVLFMFRFMCFGVNVVSRLKFFVILYGV